MAEESKSDSNTPLPKDYTGISNGRYFVKGILIGWMRLQQWLGPGGSVPSGLSVDDLAMLSQAADEFLRRAIFMSNRAEFLYGQEDFERKTVKARSADRE